MIVPGLLGTIDEERRRRLDGLTRPDARALEDWARALDDACDPVARERLEAAFRFARGIDYRHEGLAADIYFSHPLRVAAMALRCGASASPDIGAVGLLHNVLEVSELSGAELEVRFGSAVADDVRRLTVDRAMQWDPAYKRDYYAALREGRVNARVVKVFDKLDNLYLLGLNDDRAVKATYLQEIVEYVVPLADRNLPSVAPYLRALVNETIGLEGIALPTL
jgi:(p)ppGpp synthase/HD superfamily hydrolase